MLKTKFYFVAAKLNNMWRHAYKDAASSIEEMTQKDIYYWVFKSANPVRYPVKGEHVLENMNRDNRCVRLPLNFNEEKSITFAAVGDLLRSNGLDDSKDRLYAGVSDLIFNKSISYANFESPITMQTLRPEIISDREAPIECCSHDQFETLKGHLGQTFTVMNTANNHILDMGLEGIQTTLKTFEDQGITNVGTSMSTSDMNVGRVVEVEGVKIGFASVTFSLNGRTLPEDQKHLVNVADLLSKRRASDLTSMKAQIDSCKQKKCDFIIASLHWGYEFEFFPRERQVEIAHKLVEYGADAIIGHHPHVVQPVEYYRTARDPNRIAVIAYSLGSLTWGFAAPHLALSAILNLTITRGAVDGETKTYISTGKCTPVFRRFVRNGKRTSMLIEKLSSHLGSKTSPHSRNCLR